MLLAFFISIIDPISANEHFNKFCFSPKIDGTVLITLSKLFVDTEKKLCAVYISGAEKLIFTNNLKPLISSLLFITTNNFYF